MPEQGFIAIHTLESYCKFNLSSPTTAKTNRLIQLFAALYLDFRHSVVNRFSTIHWAFVPFAQELGEYSLDSQEKVI